MTTVNSTPLLSGYRLADYILDSVISMDYVSITYKAADKNSDQFIIKEYYPSGLVHRSADGELFVLEDSRQEQFTKEKNKFIRYGQAISELDSPILVNVVDVLEHNNSAYIISKYEETYSLTEIFRQTAVLDYEDIKNIFFPIINNLRYLHRKDLLHLSIKPDNILIRRDGTPVLTGFASYFMTGAGDVSIGMLSNHQYAPAEQFTRQENMVGPWSDIYALGAVLYQCITGAPPEHSLKRYESMKKFSRDNLKKAMDSGSGKYSPVMLRAIDHALEIRPKNRPGTLDEWGMEFLELDPMDETTAPVVDRNLDQTLRIENTEIRDAVEIEYEEETRHKLYRAYLGGKKQSYYMATFLNQESKGLFPVISFNVGAFIFHLFWLCYRKMYLSAAVLLVLAAAVSRFIVYPFLRNYINLEHYLLVNPAVDISFLFFIMFMALVLGFFGNYLYFLHVRTRLDKVDQHDMTVDTKRKLLSEIPSTSVLSCMTAVLVFSGIFFLGSREIIFREKSAVDQINEAVNALIHARNEVQKFKLLNNRWPDNAAAVFGNLKMFNYKYVGDITVMKQLIVVTFSEREDVITDLSGRSIALMGTDDNTDGKISWICGSIDVPLQYLPADCRINLK